MENESRVRAESADESKTQIPSESADELERSIPNVSADEPERLIPSESVDVRERVVPSYSAEICMICGREQTDGLHIVEEFICLDCERELVKTDVWDAKYPFFIHRMKQVWQRKNA